MNKGNFTSRWEGEALTAAAAYLGEDKGATSMSKVVWRLRDVYTANVGAARIANSRFGGDV